VFPKYLGIFWEQVSVALAGKILETLMKSYFSAVQIFWHSIWLFVIIRNNFPKVFSPFFLENSYEHCPKPHEQQY
jgi:hypothetical protein